MAIYTGRSYSRGIRFRDASGAPVPLSGTHEIRLRRVANGVTEPPPAVVFPLAIDGAVPGRLVFTLPSTHTLTVATWRFEVVHVDTETRLCGGHVPVHEGL